GGYIYTGQLIVLGCNYLSHGGWYVQCCQKAIQGTCKGIRDKDAQHGNGEQPGRARNSIVDTGGNTGVAGIYGTHHRRCERRDAYPVCGQTATMWVPLGASP